MMRLMNDYIKYWSSSGINVDLKVLLMPKSDTKESIESVFQYAKDVSARMCYFRLCLMDATSIDNFGEDLVACPRSGGLYYWDNTDGVDTRAVAFSALRPADFSKYAAFGPSERKKISSNGKRLRPVVLSLRWQTCSSPGPENK